MRRSRLKRTSSFLCLIFAIVFAVLWVRSYWYDTFLGYEARVTEEHVNHHFSAATDSGAFDIAIKWESLNPTYRREHGVWTFHDSRHGPSSCGVVGEPKPSFLGFQHWVVESPDSYRYNYTWIPFWFPTALFALPALWYFVRTRRASRTEIPC